jgi:glutamate/tyrosine decarboxylase-like PLP-dependent enzyme
VADSDEADTLLGDLHPYASAIPVHTRLPERGRPREEVLAQLESMAAVETRRWDRGQVSGTYYHGGRDHYAFLNRAFALYAHANLLQRDLCPSGTKLEGEVIAMTARLLHGDVPGSLGAGDQVCGSMTSGGTESIFSAMLVCREYGRRERGLAIPEVIAPSTIHPAFQKAAHYLGMTLTLVPVKDFLADVDAMRARIGPSTVALVGSAGNYPWGLIDPLPALSALAVERGLLLHVDGCLGGFILPFVERLGYPVPVFDFRLPGVTSMSCDTHKYGYALKGTSVVLYRRPALRRLQYFSAAGWQGGVYASPTAAGSRSEGLAAATWASLVATGEDGYLESARAIMKAADALRTGVAGIEGLEILGQGTTFLVAIASGEVDIFHVNDFLGTRGWRLNGCQDPPAVHFCVTLPQTQPGVIERLVEDLRQGLAYARTRGGEPPRSGAMYGLASTPDGKLMLEEAMLGWLDATYEPE